MKQSNTIIILNGDTVSKSIFRKFCKRGDYIICADGGANSARKLGVKPDIIIGDLDSISRTNLSYFKKLGVEVRKISEQETTDFEKSLMYAVEFGLDNIIVFGATGSRTDHVLNIYSVMKRYCKVLNLRIIDNEFEIFYLKEKIEKKYGKNKLISLLGMPAAKGVTTKGLKYGLNGESLEFGVREGTLNFSSANKIMIEKKAGDLLVFLKHS